MGSGQSWVSDEELEAEREAEKKRRHDFVAFMTKWYDENATSYGFAELTVKLSIDKLECSVPQKSSRVVYMG